MRIKTGAALAAAASFAFVLAACGGGNGGAAGAGGENDSRAAAASPADAEKIAALELKIEALEHRKTLLEDANAVKRLQRAYGYYIDRGLWDQAADLFAADGTIEIGLDGVYVGQERVREYLHALGGALGGGENGLPEGRLNEHMQLQGVVTVAPDGLTAKARWRDLVMQGQLGKDAAWGEGPYENEYVKEDGVWKIKTLHWYQSMLVPYQGGWAKNEDVNGAKYVSDTLPPDRPPTLAYKTWPATFLPPFHFDNPVTGKPPPVNPPAEKP
ncbi:MAG TPA: nuclear transport factor 2 family protein [Gammaproteobacteria bacterium]|nr:nuclear transport factor 2 family protein [Gammaproteobacteria bacterium]